MPTTFIGRLVPFGAVTLSVLPMPRLNLSARPLPITMPFGIGGERVERAGDDLFVDRRYVLDRRRNDTRERHAFLAAGERQHRRADQHRRNAHAGQRLDELELLSMAADAAGLGLRLHVADLHGAVVPEQRRGLDARQPVLVVDGDVGAVVDEAPHEVLLGAAHQRRHREEERDAEHHAGKRDERLALAGRQVRRGDIEREHHFVAVDLGARTCARASLAHVRTGRVDDACVRREPIEDLDAAGASDADAHRLPVQSSVVDDPHGVALQRRRRHQQSVVALGDDQVRVDGHADFAARLGFASLMRTR